MPPPDEENSQAASRQNRKRGTAGFNPELPPPLESLDPELDAFADPEPAPATTHSTPRNIPQPVSAQISEQLAKTQSLAQRKAERAARIAAQAKAGLPLENVPRHSQPESPADEIVIRHKPKKRQIPDQAPAKTRPQRRPQKPSPPSDPLPDDEPVERFESLPVAPVVEPEPQPPVEQKVEQQAVAARPQVHQPVVNASGEEFLLHTHGLKKVYDGRAVVNGVDVTVRPSEIVGLLGPNGAGKTTSFYMIVGLVQPNGGKVIFNGQEATNEPMYRRARMGMGYLPQEESIFRKMTVEDNIMSVMEAQGLGRAERRDKCRDLMHQFGIDKLAKNIAITLSGGEKRRLTIARSLVTNPTLLMLDEPFSGVDPIAVGEIQEIIRQLREQGLAILITDHNVRETLGIVDRAYLMFEGAVKREGTRDFLINDPLSRQLYLGERFTM